ncbi:hypothetical protein SPRG_03127 [Saprolegnia parasitica CBS 223.65]|uniref:Kinesin-like protein n=1 Tax=Saprolegnia parasitica (strain CBS 223.65) TaxID=695850 RepID=A0A067CZF9_SAPPC|nr:hypothetical protein SPRG_03127 [Saprolegnia parasitica CBS 223.65]KDO31911.1 hypothetical protein SPRG_03127 [Saprolegnia parasitica CBS 223.65]|eukprot:XP_012197110.1 hypothetical protein SPRG_03127 [Saprolegnia parasitica CBS 223.65]
MDDNGRMLVAVRLRPKLATESHELDAVTVLGEKLQLLHAPWTRLHTSYQFDHVFQASASNADIYARFLAPVVASVVRGNHATILAYGQTGTGKTHTMLGRDLWGLCASPEHPPADLSPDAGLMGLVAAALLQHEASLQCTYLELYNDKVYDLLADGSVSLELREDASVGVYAPDARTVSVASVDALVDILWCGAETRAHCATNMNERSSRSHTLLQLTLPTTGQRVNLVDLAGSEKCKYMAGDGQHVKELKFINQSLSNLGQCITALLKRGKKHVPYRNCKLTRLLQHSLEGRALCAFIVTLNPCASNTMETLSTLQFAARAMKVKVVSRDIRLTSVEAKEISSTASSALLAQVQALQMENQQLRAALIHERSQKSKLLAGFTSLLQDTASVERVDSSTQIRRESFCAGDGGSDNNNSNLSDDAATIVAQTHASDAFILDKLSLLEQTVQRQLQDIRQTKERLVPRTATTQTPDNNHKTDGTNQWEEYVDARTGFKYFHNPSTGETQWKKPPAAGDGRRADI